MPTTPTIAVPFYLIDRYYLNLDEFDGYTARTLNQSNILFIIIGINLFSLTPSSFGATLDMIILTVTIITHT